MTLVLVYEPSLIHSLIDTYELTPYGPYLNWPMRMGYTYICIHGLSTTTTLVDVIHPLADTLTCLLLDLVVPKGRFEECVQTNLEAWMALFRMNLIFLCNVSINAMILTSLNNTNHTE